MTEPATPRLSNTQFRDFIMTPRAGGSTAVTPMRMGQNSEFRKPNPNDAQKKKKKPPKSKPQLIRDSQYKDRAKERREGVNQEYEDEPEENKEDIFLDKSGMTPGSKSQSTSRVDIEKSKDYGGDEDTTHKVKGLDFALLTKSKMRIMKEEREAEEKKKEAQVIKQEEKVTHTISRDGVHIDAPKEYQSRMGKSLYNAIFVKQREPIVDHFLPGRTTFVYELDTDSDQDLPTTVHRSREAFDQGKQLELAVTHPDILARITKIMVYYTQGAKAYKKLKKKQKKEKEEAEGKAGKDANKQNQTTAKKDVIEEEDIFDIGDDYIPSAIASKDGVKAYSSYVTTLAPVAKPLQQIQETRDKSISEYKRAMEQQQQQNPEPHKPQALKDEREKDPSFVSDVYAECYPGAFEHSGPDGMRTVLAGSDDEEEDLTKMDSRTRLKRWDFESDQAWEEYESKREATPKAAFQFGVKNKDGRKPQKKNEAKLKQQLKQLEGMYEEKTGKKFADDEDHERHEGDVDTNSYEHKLMQKRVREISTGNEGIFNFNKKKKNSNDVMIASTTRAAQEPRTPRMEPRTPGGKRDLTEPRTPGGSSFNPNLFK